MHCKCADYQSRLRWIIYKMMYDIQFSHRIISRKTTTNHCSIVVFSNLYCKMCYTKTLKNKYAVVIDLKFPIFSQRNCWYVTCKYDLVWLNGSWEDFVMTLSHFWNFGFISPLKKTWPFIQLILNILYPRMICLKFDWNSHAVCGEDFIQYKHL
jgi:hypothetical protein